MSKGGGCGRTYRLSPSTSLRREAFGAISYSHDTRRLHVIQSRLAAEVASRLDAGAAVDDLIDWLARGEQPRRDAAARQIARTIDGLVTSGVLVEFTDPA